MKQDIIISIDIGGTTFESAILDKNYLNIMDMSKKWHVRDYHDSEGLIEGIYSQITGLLNKNTLDKNRIFVPFFTAFSHFSKIRVKAVWMDSFGLK